MGGRGASSGGRFLKDGTYLPYGSEYGTVLQSGNIKFVKANRGAATAPLETMSKGRVYVTINEQGNKLKSISFYDRENKRFRQIDLDHYHKINGKAQKPHMQVGYYHDGEASVPTAKDSRLIDKVLKAWYNK